MARLGHVGYALYSMGGITFVVSPLETKIVEEEIEEYELTAMLESAGEDESEWIDHKINWSITLYGTEVGKNIAS